MKALKSKVLLVPWGREEKLWMESREEEDRRDLCWAEKGTSPLIYSTSTADTHLELRWKQQPYRVDGVLLFGKQNFFCKITTFKLIKMKEIQVYDFTIIYDFIIIYDFTTNFDNTNIKPSSSLPCSPHTHKRILIKANNSFWN